jgi:hypothetical protein
VDVGVRWAISIGETMSLRLRDADARAVDLLLDRAASSAQGNGGNGHTASFAAASHAGVSNGQVAAVERVLNLLHAMPAPEPAADLLRRTLDRIDAQGHAPMRGAATPTLIDLSRPVA